MPEPEILTIYTGAGAVEYVTVTISADVDIHTDTVQLGIGKDGAPPGTWLTPDLLTFSLDGKTATAKLLIGNGHLNPVADIYRIWWRVVDGVQVKVHPAPSVRLRVTATAGAPVPTVPPWVASVTGPGVDNTDPRNPVISESAGSFSFGGWLYGDGSDGALVCTDGMTIQPGFYTDITIPDGVTVHVPRATFNVPIIRCSGTWTINGIVDLSGVDALNRLPAEVSAGQGAAPVNGSDVLTLFPLVGPFLGGEGGIGSSGPVTPTADGRGNFGNVVDTGVLDWIRLLSWLPSSHYDYDLSDYGFGRPGSGDGTNYGGAPGSGGRFFGLAARHLVHGPNSAYLIDGGHGAPGGDDGDGNTGNGDCGGGGGGAGGWWVTLSDTITGSTTVTGTGGLGGAGCGTGSNGTAGMTGRGIHYLNRT